MLLVQVLCVVVKLLVMSAGSTAAFVCMLVHVLFQVVRHCLLVLALKDYKGIVKFP